MKEPKPFGWEITVEFSKSIIYVPGYHGNWTKSFHDKGSSEGAARTRAVSKRHARAILSARPVATEADYIRMFGNYWERGF